MKTQFKISVHPSILQVTSVDRTAATIMCAVQVSDAISRQHGAEVTASKLLPLLCPFLTAPSLNGEPKRGGRCLALGNVGRGMPSLPLLLLIVWS